MEGTSATWISSRINEIHSKSDNVTVAIVVTKQQIKASEGLEFLGHLTKSKEFRQDLNMTNAYWFYHKESSRRCLLVQHTGVSGKQELRTLGAKTA